IGQVAHQLGPYITLAIAEEPCPGSLWVVLLDELGFLIGRDSKLPNNHVLSHSLCRPSGAHSSSTASQGLRPGLTHSAPPALEHRCSISRANPGKALIPSALIRVPLRLSAVWFFSLSFHESGVVTGFLVAVKRSQKRFLFRQFPTRKPLLKLLDVILMLLAKGFKIH